MSSSGPSFSSRFHWDSRPNPLTELLREKRTVGATILDLTESNPTRAGIVYPEGFLASLSDPRAATYEPEPFGLPAARELIASEFDAPSKNVVMTASYTWSKSLDMGSGAPVPQKGEETVIDFSADLPLTRELAHFLDCCRTRSQPRSDAGEALRVLRVLSDAQKALDAA